MSTLIGIPVLILLAIFQSSIMSDLALLDGRPDLVFLLVVAWGIIGRYRVSMIWALIGGLALDLLSGLPLGVTAINLILITFLVSFSEGRFWESHILMPLGVMIVVSPLFYLISIASLLLLGYEIELGFALLRVALPSTFLNLLLTFPATQLISALDHIIHPAEVSI